MKERRTILSFDFGTKYIGCAVGQEITRTARPLMAFKAQDGVPRWETIGFVIQEWQPQLLIVGLPLNIDGTEQPLTQQAKKFAKRLQQHYQLPVELHDERLTTVEAKANLFAEKGYRGLQKTAIDSQAAALILESWFEQQCA